MLSAMYARAVNKGNLSEISRGGWVGRNQLAAIMRDPGEVIQLAHQTMLELREAILPKMGTPRDELTTMQRLGDSIVADGSIKKALGNYTKEQGELEKKFEQLKGALNSAFPEINVNGR
jgi:hypothetical protein